MPSTQKSPSQFPPSPKPRFLGAPSTDPSHTWTRAWGYGPACDARCWAPPQCQHHRMLCRPRQHLDTSLERCVLVCKLSAHVCVHVTCPLLPCIETCSSLLVAVKAPQVSQSQPQSYRVQHPGVTRARGAREAELWGNGGEGPPLLSPHSCTAMKHVIFTQEQVGWRGKAPRRWSSWKEDLKKQWNKIPILRQVKKNLNITMFVCLFQPLPSPLVCIIHLHCALTRPLQGKKYPFHHKGDIF